MCGAAEADVGMSLTGGTMQRRTPSGAVSSDGPAGAPGRGGGTGRRLRRPTALAGATALAVLSGCTMVGPNYETPEAQLNDAWLEKGAEGENAAAPERWWESFKDPTLTALVQSAATQNLTLRSAGLRVIEARAR